MMPSQEYPSGEDPESRSENLRREVECCARSHGDAARTYERAGNAAGAAELRRVENLLWALARGEGWEVVLNTSPTAVAVSDSSLRSAVLAFADDMRQWIDQHRLDDDQDPALDTPDQRLVRSWSRMAAISGAGARGAILRATSCDVCDAIGFGNADCWSCVAHWHWIPLEIRESRIAAILSSSFARLGDEPSDDPRPPRDG